jgi:hypothetical protein
MRREAISGAATARDKNCNCNCIFTVSSRDLDARTFATIVFARSNSFGASMLRARGGARRDGTDDQLTTDD